MLARIPRSFATFSCLLFAWAAVPTAYAQVSLTTIGTPVTQSFDGLPATGNATWVNNTTIPGWFHARTGNGTTVVANDGSSNAGNLYSYGTGASADRALGSVGSGNAAAGNLFWGVRLQNNTGQTISSLDVVYTGEQWRNSGAAAQTIAFSYLIGAPTVAGNLAEFETAGTAVTALDFTSPITGGSAAPLDGNLAANRVLRSFSISGLSIPNGTEFMLRWSDPDQGGADHGLSIDDLSVTPQGGGPVTPFLSVNNVTANEGNAGTTSFNFTVSLTSPAGPGGVTFDIATADDTATVANNDYVARSLTGQTIPAGASSYMFSVQVNGDTTVEPNETFFVNVTNITGATADDTQGLGTIINDDAGAVPSISIADVSMAEGNGGLTLFVFDIELSSPAPPGGVSFDIATADGTATAPVDYLDPMSPGVQITAGNTSAGVIVSVIGDTQGEPNETFFVNLSNVVGATVADGQGQGTIINDDALITPIHDIQGPGASSPIVGATVTTTGIVTGRRGNGFFMQTPDAEVDADPATSQGILVFTSSAPPAAAAVGNLVQVTGTVVEFVPSQDPLQPPLTELTSPTVVQISTGNPLPAAIPLTASFPDPAGPHDQLERLEGMRVSFHAMTVGSPTQGSINEVNATATSNGVFQGSAFVLPRAFREPGIQAPDPAPPGSSIPPIPRFDSNPEVIRVDSDALGNPAINPSTRSVVSGLVGPLDYTFRRYTILQEAGTIPAVLGGSSAEPVTAALASEITIASYNLQRFFNDVDDPGISEPVLTPVAFDRRLNKASLAIRNFLRAPDILGVVEVENLSTLQALATRISSDALAASQPDPLYQAFLVEGLDVGGIDVGFLVKTAPVTGATPRVSVTAVTQQLAGSLFTNVDLSTEPLNDRPPLVLEAVINNATGQSYPLVVIVNHLRSLNDAANPGVGSNGWATVGERVRAKRLAQAVDLANLVQARQTTNPAENLVLVGDFNAFEFNDGLVDSINVITGTPTPDNQTAVPGDGMDLVNPNLLNMVTTVPAVQRYSFVFDGNAQSLDHVLVGSALQASTSARRLEHARINADFAETLRGTTGVERGADHDPLVLFLSPLGFATTDVSITHTASPDPIVAGNNLTYTITAANSGPINALMTQVSNTLPAGTTFVSLTSPVGWTCTTPAAGSGGTVSCSNPSMVPGSAEFVLVVRVDPAIATLVLIFNTATITTTGPDSNPANNTSLTNVQVFANADLSIAVSDSADPVIAGSQFNYTLAVENLGATNAVDVTLSDTLPAGTTFVSLSSPAGWSCNTPAVGAGGTVECSIASLVASTASFTLTVATDVGLADGTVLSNTATISSATIFDPDTGNNSDTETTTVNANSNADLSLDLADSADPVVAGEQLSYEATVSNAGPANAAVVNVSLPLPVGTSFVSGTVAGGGSCTESAGTVNCAFSGSVLSGGGNARAATVVLLVAPSVADGSTVELTAAVSSANTDPNPGNNTATISTDVEAVANLIAGLSAAPTSASIGSSITLTATSTNNGPSDAQDVELLLNAPAGLVFTAINATGGVCSQTGATATCTFAGATAPGTSRIATATLRIDAPAAAPITLTATSLTSDPVLVNNSASVNVTVLGVPSSLQVPSLDARGLLLLLSLMLVIGGVQLRRRG